MAKKDKGQCTGAAVTSQMLAPAGGVRMETFIPWTLVRRRVRREVITPLDAPQEFAAEAGQERVAREAAQDSALVRALGLAHHWQLLLDDGRYRTMTEIATAEGMDLGQASRVAQLARLAPDVVEACMASQGGCGLALEPLVRNKLPALWAAQRAGMAPRFTAPASAPLAQSEALPGKSCPAGQCTPSLHALSNTDEQIPRAPGALPWPRCQPDQGRAPGHRRRPR